MPPGEAEYRVVYSHPILDALNDHVDAQLRAGRQKASVSSIVKAIDDRLKREPSGFGEPLYALNAINVNVSVGFVRPFAVQFGVHEKSRSVFVRKLVLMTTEPDV